MKLVSKAAVTVAAVACSAVVSFGWSERGGVSLSVESAQARVGRPLTPVSAAGVARRQYRRGAYGYGYGPGVVGAAAVGTAAAIGTAAAVASSPFYMGWGNTSSPAYADTSDPSYGQPFYSHRAYYRRSPYYGYSGWQDYAARNDIKCAPGTMIKLEDGRMYPCQ